MRERLLRLDSLVREHDLEVLVQKCAIIIRQHVSFKIKANKTSFGVGKPFLSLDSSGS